MRKIFTAVLGAAASLALVGSAIIPAQAQTPSSAPVSAPAVSPMWEPTGAWCGGGSGTWYWPVDIARALAAKGWSAGDIPTALATFAGESGTTDPYTSTKNGQWKFCGDAYNGAGADESYGIAQINVKGSRWNTRKAQCGLTSKTQLYDVYTNLACAKKIKDSEGWGAWGAYSGRNEGNKMQMGNAALTAKNRVSSSGGMNYGGRYSTGLATKQLCVNEGASSKFTISQSFAVNDRHTLHHPFWVKASSVGQGNITQIRVRWYRADGALMYDKTYGFSGTNTFEQKDVRADMPAQKYQGIRSQFTSWVLIDAWTTTGKKCAGDKFKLWDINA